MTAGPRFTSSGSLDRRSCVWDSALFVLAQRRVLSILSCRQISSCLPVSTVSFPKALNLYMSLCPQMHVILITDLLVFSVHSIAPNISMVLLINFNRFLVRDLCPLLGARPRMSLFRVSLGWCRMISSAATNPDQQQQDSAIAIGRHYTGSNPMPPESLSLIATSP